MKTFVKSLTIILACFAFANAKAQANQISTNAVNALIEELVSPVPPKYQSGESDLTNTLEDINGFIHPNVEKARQSLIEMGTDIYPILAEHINDKRYSYSGVYAAWLNLSVGEMIKDIMAEGIETHLGGYKWRKNPTGSNGLPSFSAMVRETGGYEKYALHAKGHRKIELRNEYVRWRVAKERAYGFIDQEQEQKVIGKYLELLNEE